MIIIIIIIITILLLLLLLIIIIIIIIIIVVIIPTAPRIPPHHPSQKDKGRGVMSSVGYLLSLLSCLVAKVFSVLSCSLAE